MCFFYRVSISQEKVSELWPNYFHCDYVCCYLIISYDACLLILYYLGTRKSNHASKTKVSVSWFSHRLHGLFMCIVQSFHHLQKRLVYLWFLCCLSAMMHVLESQSQIENRRLNDVGKLHCTPLLHTLLSVGISCWKRGTCCWKRGT